MTNAKTLYEIKSTLRITKMRIVIEAEVPSTDFSRENFNSSILEMAKDLEAGTNHPRGTRLTLVTTDEIA